MAVELDMDKVIAAHQASQLRGGSSSRSSAKIFRLKGSSARIRVMPPWTSEGMFAGQFWRPAAQHWEVKEGQKGPVMCPKNTPGLEGPCPICDLVEELKAKDNDPEALMIASTIRAKQVMVMTVIDRDDPVYTAKDVVEWKQTRPDKEVPFKEGDPKLQVYPAPNTVFDSIISLVRNGGNIVDLEAGHDLVVAKTGKTRNYIKYTVTPDLRPTPAGVPDDVKLLDLSQFGYVADEVELRSMLNEGIAADYAATSKALSSGTEEPSSSLEDDEEEDLEAAMRKGL